MIGWSWNSKLNAEIVLYIRKKYEKGYSVGKILDLLYRKWKIRVSSVTIRDIVVRRKYWRHIK